MALQFWYDFASPYSYLAAELLPLRAKAAGVHVFWRPFILGPIFQAQTGLKESPFTANPAKGRYMWRDMERLSQQLGVAWSQPSDFPRNSVNAARVALAAADLGEDLVRVSRAFFRAHFVNDADISSLEVLQALLHAESLDGERILAHAGSERMKPALRANVNEAQGLGLFGAPTFITSGGELFWGQGRLDAAFEWARNSPTPDA